MCFQTSVFFCTTCFGMSIQLEPLQDQILRLKFVNPTKFRMRIDWFNWDDRVCSVSLKRLVLSAARVPKKKWKDKSMIKREQTLFCKIRKEEANNLKWDTDSIRQPQPLQHPTTIPPGSRIDGLLATPVSLGENHGTPYKSPALGNCSLASL